MQVPDIDSDDRDDPSWATVYIDEIMTNLRANERSCRLPVVNFMEKVQKRLTPRMRGVLVDWLVEVAEEYRISAEALYLCVQYVDHFLCRQPVKRSKLQLVGVAALLIATKFEEIFPQDIEELAYVTDNTYTAQEVMTSTLLLLLSPH